MNTVKEVLHYLQQHKTNLCCQDISRALKRLGFEVRDGKLGGHKIYVHTGLSSFYSGSFNCGHGKNPEVKPAYVSKIIQVLTLYENEILHYLGEEND